MTNVVAFLAIATLTLWAVGALVGKALDASYRTRAGLWRLLHPRAAWRADRDSARRRAYRRAPDLNR